MRTIPGDNSLRCSFCGKPQGATRKLIANPRNSPRAYICDECVEVCAMIIEDDRPKSDDLPNPPSSEEANALLSHPLASELLDCVTRWITQESLGQPASEELAQLRDVASRMLRK